MAGAPTIGVDIGATNTRVVALGEEAKVLGSQAFPTSPSEGRMALLHRILEAAAALHPLENAEALGVGVAGHVSPDGRSVVFMPNLGWRDVPLVAEVERLSGLRVFLLNDVRAATLAEWRLGAAKGERDAVCVFVGTGIGGGAIVDGRLLSGSGNTAGEFGHLTVVAGGRECTCGGRGCLEAYAGGTAIAAIAKEETARDPGASEEILRVALTIERIDAAAVAQAAARGDPLSLRVVEGAGEALGAGLVSLANAFDPAVIVLGGGVIEGLPRIAEIAERVLRDRAIEPIRERVKVRRSALGSLAVAVGAAVYAADRAGNAGQ